MPEQPSTRKLESVDRALYSEYRNCDRWAVIVGISRYQYSGWNLKYADRDAEELYRLLLTPNGGGFKQDYIHKLTNQNATTSNITRALRSFLKKPAREDLVLIYFACHGTPDFDRPDNVYMLTHDTSPDDIAGTALPMREIDSALKENLLAEKVIILADTCHSAAISRGMNRRSGTVDKATFVNRYLQEVSQAKGGIALLTSAEANEVSFEDSKWGDGHGVFTHYLLEGMRGNADYDRNGIVTVGELFEYVREQVKLETNHKQHPAIGTDAYDRNLPVSIVPNAIFLATALSIAPNPEQIHQASIQDFERQNPINRWTRLKTQFSHPKLQRASFAAVTLIVSAIGLWQAGLIKLPAWVPTVNPTASSTQNSSTGKVNQDGLSLIQSFENLSLEAYQDAAGVWTIGYGHTQDVKPGMIITQEQAEELFKQDVTEFETAVQEMVKVPLNDNQFSALVSFAYNIGTSTFASSTLLKQLNAGDYQGATTGFVRWNRVGGRELVPLYSRRLAERALFVGEDYRAFIAPQDTSVRTTNQNGLLVIKSFKSSGQEQPGKPLSQTILPFETAIQQSVKVPLNDNQFSALVSLAYSTNLNGFSNSALLRKLNAEDYEGAANEFLRWGSQEDINLYRQRLAERSLFQGKDFTEFLPPGSSPLPSSSGNG